MKTRVILLLLLSFIVAEVFSQANTSDQAFTSVQYSPNFISVRNFDGARYTITINGYLVTLANSNGNSSSINYSFGSSDLVTMDGTNLSVLHSGLSSTIVNPDGANFFVSHMRNRSSSSTVYGTHTINHNFNVGYCPNRRITKVIDVLIHANWFTQRQAEEEAVETAN